MTQAVTSLGGLAVVKPEISCRKFGNNPKFLQTEWKDKFGVSESVAALPSSVGVLVGIAGSFLKTRSFLPDFLSCRDRR